MFRFAREPKGSIDAFPDRSTETIWLWLDSSMLLLSENAHNATMGSYPFFYGERSGHAEMVGVTHIAWWWETTSLFGRFLKSFGPGYAYGG